MHGSEITTHVRHSRLMDEFDKFVAKEGESLDFVYEWLTTLVNIINHNNVRPIPLSINTKAKKAAKNHDPLAFIAHSNASSSHSHANPSYSPQSYYVTHPPSVADYEYEYQGDSLRISSNIRNQDVVQDDRVDIQTKNACYGRNTNKNAGRNINQVFNAGNASDESNQIVQHVPRTDSTPGKANVQCYNCNEKGHYARECQKPKVRDAKYFREQMLLAMKDKAESNLSNEENDFMLDNAYGEKTLDELTTSVMLMARIQPADGNAKTVPSYDAKAVSQLAKKAFKDRENKYLEDIVDLEEKLSSHDRIVNKMGQSIQTIHMLGKKPNKLYDPFLKAGLGYQNPEHLKKAIVAQPKMYDGYLLHSDKLIIDSPDLEETLEDAKES
nr:hypothetical protein [Tanacetum cinerariifolium]